MLEDVQVKLDILYDSMQAFITVASINRKDTDIPSKEVDAMLRVYCNYLEEIQTDISQMVETGRSEEK
ncbi:hypothetical protein MKD14_15435 [[Clostridium] innocuum]|nr:hypothetical protein [[Clostridium] innocuum]